MKELWRFRQQGTRTKILVYAEESDVLPGAEYHEFRNVGFSEKWDQASEVDFVPITYARKVNETGKPLPMQEGPPMTCIRRIPTIGSVVEGLSG